MILLGVGACIAVIALAYEVREVAKADPVIEWLVAFAGLFAAGVVLGAVGVT